jgi:glycosyltransferase involved in cell wall biosynthesis
MRVLFLSSAHPSFEHSEAVSTVFALMMESFALRGAQVSWAVDVSPISLSQTTINRLKALGVRMFADFSSEIAYVPSGKFFRRIAMLRSAFLSLNRDDSPRFRSNDSIARRINESDADVVILFWDTTFEFIVPCLQIPVVAYAAKPRYEAAMVRQREKSDNFFYNRVRRYLTLRRLKLQQQRHLKRMNGLAAFTNIDRKDAAAYTQMGIPCEYVPNMWGDVFGDDWRKKRSDVKKSCERINIFGSFSTLTSTGNLIGIRYWTENILPRLDQSMTKDWVINVYGKGADLLPGDIRARLSHPNVDIRGFVPDIDREFLVNQIFLLCNNTGLYSGGYTRVIYAMASGCCLISHRNLAKSMPEVIDGENALLCETPDEFISAITRLADSVVLREKMATNARATYLRCYEPSVVSAQLIKICEKIL